MTQNAVNKPNSGWQLEDAPRLPLVLRFLPVQKLEYRSPTRGAEGAWWVYLSKEDLPSALRVLKYHGDRAYQTLRDMIGVDGLTNMSQANQHETGDQSDQSDRFRVIYVLLSYRYQTRLHLVVRVDEYRRLPSVVSLYPAANWYEREIWDMYGIPFEGHPDLRRLLTDYGFQGHPMRKDFPLRGYTEVRYDEERKRVLYEPVQLRQGYRRFDFDRPWTKSE